jgi:hypothetical protein
MLRMPCFATRWGGIGTVEISRQTYLTVPSSCSSSSCPFPPSAPCPPSSSAACRSPSWRGCEEEGGRGRNVCHDLPDDAAPSCDFVKPYMCCHSPNPRTHKNEVKGNQILAHIDVFKTVTGKPTQSFGCLLHRAMHQ